MAAAAAAAATAAAMKMEMKMARPLPGFLVDPPLTWREEGMPIRPAGDGETIMRPGPREWKHEAFFAAFERAENVTPALSHLMWSNDLLGGMAPAKPAIGLVDVALWIRQLGSLN